jgi:hypothetical protein
VSNRVVSILVLVTGRLNRGWRDWEGIQVIQSRFKGIRRKCRKETLFEVNSWRSCDGMVRAELDCTSTGLNLLSIEFSAESL